jgi:two-component system, chemotaxis family, chemotaxis protein CheY
VELYCRFRAEFNRGVVFMGYKFDRLRLLIVDDNLHMRKMLSEVVRAIGAASVYEAPNGVQAWAKFRDLNPDIIFLDWMMPGMTGLEFARLARTSEESPNPYVAIVMVTGYTQAEHVRQARDAGVTEFLAKPISANTVLARMTAVIENPRSFVRTPDYFGPCRRRRNDENYRGPERRAPAAAARSAGRSATGGNWGTA